MTAEKRTAKRQKTDAETYRQPMLVTELRIYWPQDSYYVCPRCQRTMDREFTAYCDRCGQCLNWSQYKKVKLIWVE